MYVFLMRDIAPNPPVCGITCVAYCILMASYKIGQIELCNVFSLSTAEYQTCHLSDLWDTPRSTKEALQ